MSRIHFDSVELSVIFSFEKDSNILFMYGIVCKQWFDVAKNSPKVLFKDDALEEEIDSIISSNFLQNLEDFSLTGIKITDLKLKMFSKCNIFNNLKKLSLIDGDFSLGALISLLSSKYFDNLVSLDIGVKVWGLESSKRKGNYLRKIRPGLIIKHIELLDMHGGFGNKRIYI